MANHLLIFGIHPVLEALEAGKQIERIFLKRGIASPMIDRIRQISSEDRVPLQEVPVEKLNRLTQGNHQGVAAQLSPIEYAELSEVMNAVMERGEIPLVVVLDGVTDVRNFGAIARSAECAGVHAVVVPVKYAAPVNADAVKSSAGALNILPVCRVGSIRNTLKYLESCGLQLVAATEKAPKSLFESDFRGPTVWVMGSEDTGISKEVLKLCKEQVSIPMKGKIGSLNVSAAAAVMLFETVRQRGVQ